MSEVAGEADADCHGRFSEGDGTGELVRAASITFGCQTDEG